MYYYQLVFNRPLHSTYTYASEKEIVIGSRVNARLHSTVLPAIVVAKEEEQKVQDLRSKNIIIKAIERNKNNQEYAQKIYTPELMELAQWMSQYYICSLGQCLFTLISAVSSKKAKELSFPKNLISYFPKDFPSLTEEQKNALFSINQAIDRNASEYVYLHGVTGSGKTEVYLQSMQHAILQKKQVIYLLPEIALLEQVLPLMAFRFGEKNIAVLHSRLTPNQKLYQWKRILHSEVSIIVGVRSAIFAPCKQLGLIIIDEENDSSYKSDKAPRYHARQVAMWRSNKAKALLLMGSATPSLESWHSIQEKTIRCISLSKRISTTGFPNMQVVSLQGKHAISEELEKAIQHSLSLNKQIILLVNKRGFSHAFLCEQCGKHFECPNCSVSLVSHRTTKRFLLCHHCGYSMEEPELCPSCGYTALSVRGWGTQRVEREIQKLFPLEKIVRLDSDNTKKKGETAQLLFDFYNRKYSIMIGTQMIAKGINIPNLHLVGILFCDSLFTLPDFRAYEKAYALLEQATGRASRFSKKGHVIIQSYAEDISFLQHFIDRNQSAFYEEELQKRQQYNLAPFCRMLRLVFRGANEDTVVATVNECASIISKKASNISFLGPAPCALYKISKNYRMHIILRSNSQKQLLHVYRNAILPEISSIALKNKVYIEVDPDPMNVM